jgi:multicomponent K+:H+ antiporter subunit D
MILVGVSKAGSTVFWHHEGEVTKSGEQHRVHPAQLAALIILISGAPLMSLFAGPLSEYAMGAATQLHDFNNNIKVILLGGQ